MIAATCFAMACNNSQPDSVDMAKDQNAAIDSTAGTGDSLDFDNNFMVEAASGGLMEVQLGELAIQHAASPAVKEFGQMMVTDHSKANSELTALAQTKNITVPSVPGDDQQKEIDKLYKETGADFDKDYVDLMVDDHKDDIDEFQKAADKAKDADIKAFAEKTVPVLKKHLDHIQAIKDNMK